MDIYNHILQALEKDFCLSEGTKYIPVEKKRILKKASEILDECWKAEIIESIDLTTGTGDNSLNIALNCMDIIVMNGRNNFLFQLVTLADSVHLSQKDIEYVRMGLKFRNVVQSMQPEIQVQ